MKKASRVFLNTYAAYGGIYIAASLIWLWAVEGQRPTFTDSVGAAIAGAILIIGFASKSPWLPEERPPAGK